MKRIERIAGQPSIQAAIATFAERVMYLVELTIEVQQIPAPTFAEAERAAFIERRFAACGLQDVGQDELYNVYGRFPAKFSAGRPPLIISAHSDTVFPADTDLSVRQDGRFIYGPGIGDNAAGVAGIIFLAETVQAHNIALARDVWFVSNVGEEGLGDLRGMQAVVQRFGSEASYIVVEGGLYGQISHQAIGVRRYEIAVRAPGGHSWGNFGQRSAIHELGRLIVAVDDLVVPQQPKTTFNVGVIEGGTSINTIAQTARMLLDLRSEDPEELQQLVAQVKQIVARKNRFYRRTAQGETAVAMKQIGNRPAGSIPRDTPLVAWAEAALRLAGRDGVQFIASSTDANIPLSQGITAVCIGLTESNNAHRLDEYLDPTYLPQGMTQLLLLTLAAAGFDE